MPGEDTKILDRELAKLRRQQAARVMPVASDVLEWWDQTPADTKQQIRELAPELSKHLDKLEIAMEA